MSDIFQLVSSDINSDVRSLKKDIDFLRQDVAHLRWLVSSMELRYRFREEENLLIEKIENSKEGDAIYDYIKKWKKSKAEFRKQIKNDNLNERS